MSSKYELLLENVPLLFLIADISGEIIKVNSYWEKVLGYKKEELIGTNFIDLIHPEDKQIVISEMQQMVLESRVCEKLVNRWKCKKITKENQALLLPEGYINLEWYAGEWYNDRVCAVAIFRF